MNVSHPLLSLGDSRVVRGQVTAVRHHSMVLMKVVGGMV